MTRRQNFIIGLSVLVAIVGILWAIVAAIFWQRAELAAVALACAAVATGRTVVLEDKRRRDLEQLRAEIDAKMRIVYQLKAESIPRPQPRFGVRYFCGYCSAPMVPAQQTCGCCGKLGTIWDTGH